MEIVFLQNSATQPRCHKRYRSLVAAGVKGIVYSFNRNWYNVNLPEDIEIHSLGEITKGHYAKRLVFYIRKIKPVFKNHPNAVFYCYGLDIAFVAFLFRRNFVYEESDLEYLNFKSPFMRKSIKKLDLLIQKKSKATVLTSQGFVEYLYKSKPKNIFVLPNKLPSSYEHISRPLPPETIDMGRLRFAFVGLLRYESTITPFIEEMVACNKNFEFHFWGDGAESEKAYVNSLCTKYEQVFYHGPFRNPGDLPSIYSSIDVNFVCYETNTINERVAEPNKLYESIYYLKPMIVSPNTYLSNVVQRIGNGFILDCHNKNDINNFLNTLTEDLIQNKILACKKVPSNEVMDSVEDINALLDYIK